jgi:DNA-binding transcriptional MerR regulator
MYTVKQLAELAGVTPRTLHHYDEIGLLRPTKVAANSYRYYDEKALLRLQQIMFYRELDIDLVQIKKILDDKRFDLVSALQSHHENLENEVQRLQVLIKTVDATIMHLTGEVKMSEEKIFEGFSEEKQKEYEKQAAQQWGEDRVKQSVKLWKSYSDADRKNIMQEGSEVYKDLIAHMQKGPDAPVIQSILGRWHQHLRYFYEPTFDVLRGLGNAYNEHPDFNATFTAMHPDLPAFLQKSINNYVDELELESLERELNVLEDKH